MQPRSTPEEQERLRRRSQPVPHHAPPAQEQEEQEEEEAVEEDPFWPAADGLPFTAPPPEALGTYQPHYFRDFLQDAGRAPRMAPAFPAFPRPPGGLRLARGVPTGLALAATSLVAAGGFPPPEGPVAAGEMLELELPTPEEGARLSVLGLSPRWDKLFLYELFAPFGAILSVSLEETDGVRCGLVQYLHTLDALRAMVSMDNAQIGRRQLQVAVRLPEARQNQPE